eukprot:NP_001033549.1 Uncharacterized protein CELE_F43E12.1 [Caenorhabditis elegans]
MLSAVGFLTNNAPSPLLDIEMELLASTVTSEEKISNQKPTKEDFTMLIYIVQELIARAKKIIECGSLVICTKQTVVRDLRKHYVNAQKHDYSHLYPTIDFYLGHVDVMCKPGCQKPFNIKTDPVSRYSSKMFKKPHTLSSCDKKHSDIRHATCHINGV